LKNIISGNTLLFKTKFYYGWIIVALAALSIFFSGPGQTYSISIFINEYVSVFGWSRTFISSLYSGATILSGTLLFIIGSIRGFIMIAFVIASALGPLPFGAAYDHFGSYTIIIYIMAAFPVLGSIAALLSEKPGASLIK